MKKENNLIIEIVSKFNVLPSGRPYTVQELGNRLLLVGRNILSYHNIVIYMEPNCDNYQQYPLDGIRVVQNTSKIRYISQLIRILN